MKVLRLALVLALLAVPAALHAQQGQGQGMRGGMGMMRENVAEFIVTKAADLDLSQDQITRITTIGRELREKTDSQMAEMRTAMQGGGMQNMSQADRQRMMERRDAMAAEAEEARKQVLALLSDTQKPKAEALLEEWDRNRPAMQRRGGGRPA